MKQILVQTLKRMLRALGGHVEYRPVEEFHLEGMIRGVSPEGEAGPWVQWHMSPDGTMDNVEIALPSGSPLVDVLLLSMGTQRP